MYYNFEDKYYALKYRLKVLSLLNKDLEITICGGAIIVTKTLRKGMRDALIAFIADTGHKTTISTRAESVHVRMDPDVVINFVNDVKRIAHLVRDGANVMRIKDNAGYFRKLCMLKTDNLITILDPSEIIILPQLSNGKRFRVTVTNTGHCIQPHEGRVCHKEELNRLFGLLTEKDSNANIN